MANETQQIKTYDEVLTGVAVYIYNLEDDTLLMVQRHPNNPHGSGLWSIPGGKQEKGETPEDAAVREVLQEVGLDFPVKTLTFCGYTSDVFDNGRHYNTLFYCASIRFARGDTPPANLEPDKHAQIAWIPFQEVPYRDLFKPNITFFRRPLNSNMVALRRIQKAFDGVEDNAVTLALAE